MTTPGLTHLRRGLFGLMMWLFRISGFNAEQWGGHLHSLPDCCDIHIVHCIIMVVACHNKAGPSGPGLPLSNLDLLTGLDCCSHTMTVIYCLL